MTDYRDTQHVELAGPNEVYFKKVGGEDELGHTLGDISAKISQELVEHFADQIAGCLERTVSKQEVSVTIPFVQNQIGVIRRYLGESLVVVDGGLNVVAFGSETGYRMSAQAYELRVHPRRDGADHSHDLYLFKAHVDGNLTRTYSKGSQQVMEITFKALVDITRGDKSYLGCFGDIRDLS